MLNKPAAVLVRLNDSINTGNNGAKNDEYKSCTKCALDTVITSGASKLLEVSGCESMTAKENSYSQIGAAVLPLYTETDRLESKKLQTRPKILKVPSDYSHFYIFSAVSQCLIPNPRQHQLSMSVQIQQGNPFQAAQPFTFPIKASFVHHKFP